MTRLRIAAFAALVAAVAGCGKSGPSSKVSGTVTYKGRVVSAGVVYLKYDQGGQYESPLRTDGTYAFGDLPTGTAKVVIDTETFNPDQTPPSYTKTKGGKKISEGISKGLSEYDKVSGGGAMAQGAPDTSGGPTAAVKEELAKIYVKIPKKYGHPQTSPLSLTIEGGSQTKDFELTD